MNDPEFVARLVGEAQSALAAAEFEGTVDLESLTMEVEVLAPVWEDEAAEMAALEKISGYIEMRIQALSDRQRVLEDRVRRFFSSRKDCISNQGEAGHAN